MFSNGDVCAEKYGIILYVSTSFLWHSTGDMIVTYFVEFMRTGLLLSVLRRLEGVSRFSMAVFVLSACGILLLTYSQQCYDTQEASVLL